MIAFPKRSLRAQFALWTIIATGLLISLVLFSYAFLSYRLFLHDYQQEIANRMEIAAAPLEFLVKQTDYIGMLKLIKSLKLTKGVVGVRILDANKSLLMYRGESNGFLLQRSILYDKQPIGTIQVIFSDTPIKDKVRVLFLLGVAITLVVVPFAALLMWFVSGHQLKDLLALSREVHQIGDIESKKINLTGINRQDEIGNLARSIAKKNSSIMEGKKQEQLLYHAINQSHDSVVITDANAKIKFVNPAFSRITGYSQEEAFDQNPHILQSGKHPVKFFEVMWQTLLNGETWKGLIINKRKNGEEYQEEATITPMIDRYGQAHHYVAMKRDVTQEVVLKRKLARAEKMQALGMMAGGVAHDLNNILSGIIGYPELILLQLPKDSKLWEPIEAIRKSGKRAAMVVADLLTVARGTAITRVVYDLSALIREYLDSPEHKKLKSLYPNIVHHQQFDAKQHNISCSPVHIKKCLMNLVTNAVEAIDDAGTVTISTHNQYIEDATGLAHEIKGGDFVVLSVRDTGPGMLDADLEHIFEPFYTKKEMGRSGTGIGLAIVWNTVQDHDGKIHVESNTEGSDFQLYFPVTGKKGAVQFEKDKEESFTGNGERILVVDDEPQLREIACQMLQALGYTADSVSSGELAIKFMQETTVDLIVLDMLMDPGMNGYQTYEEIIKLYPNQKALIVSGFSKSNDVKATLKLGAGGFIKKPYTMDQLSHAVKKVLN